MSLMNELLWLEPDMNYEEYRAFDHWQRIRADALHRAAYKCQLCATRDEQLDVHHNAYRFWNERPCDVIVLCHRCHIDFHQRRRYTFSTKITKYIPRKAA